MKKKILITNDDGIDSPGLSAAVSAVSDLGEIVIAAPSRQQTGMGRSMFGDRESRFIRKTLMINRKKFKGRHFDGSPALIVQHCINTVFWGQLPDLIISGINYGENLGSNILQSGTLGAAMEGASYGIPAIAVSMQTRVDQFKSYAELDWTAAVYFLSLFSKKLLTRKFEKTDLLKIDIPFNATKETDWKWTRQSNASYYYTKINNPDEFSKIGDADFGIQYDESRLETDSDIYVLIKEKKVSVTPITLNMTANVDFDTLNNQMSRS